MKKSLEERRRREWRKFRHKALKFRQQGNDLLISDLAEETLHKHERTSSKGISSSSRKKLGRRAMILDQPNANRESETELSSGSLNRTFEDKVTVQWETESHPFNMSDSFYELSVQSTTSINNELISEMERLQDAITFAETNKSKDMTLNGSDMSLLQILQSLKNENDCVSVANTPPKMTMLTAGVISTSCNETVVE